ncbi:MAG TPA: zf-HC2 domain-containing protein [Pyrinomonadaceae bacterium]|nr:zf-HC2 domain-containing protein [Pyrinomonadaceae bacterium]
MPRPKSNKESDRLRRMVHQHLSRRGSLAPASAAAGAHLDEDALSVFVEGRLSEREAAPLIRHLVACASCRHITTQLIRLDTELSAAETPAPLPPAEEPGRIRRLLADLAARVLPSSEDDVVFAYHAPADDFEKKDEPKKGEEPENQEGE